MQLYPLGILNKSAALPPYAVRLSRLYERPLGKSAAFEGCSEKQLRCLGESFGVGPYAKPHVPHYRDCPKCGEKKARVKETHADTGMDEMELKCDACGKWSDIESTKSASVGDAYTQEKSAVVKQDPDTGKWVLWTKDGKRKLGTHETPDAAHKQEYAIQKSMAKEAAEPHQCTTNTCPDCGSVTKCKCPSGFQTLPRKYTHERCYKCGTAKEAAEIVRKPRTEYDDHCPHCDHKFQEKGYPRRKRNGESDEEWLAAWDSGDYDEHCPSCDGIVDQKELSDDEINSSTWGGNESIKARMRERRDAQRRRKSNRDWAAGVEKKAKQDFKPFVGFDLDGTLAKRQKEFDINSVGEPVPKMIAQLRKHLKAGDTVKIFTARASTAGCKPPIHKFLKAQGLPKLEITNVKTPGLTKLYDDRAVGVKVDTGEMFDPYEKKAARLLPLPTPGTFQSLGRYGHGGDLVRMINAVKRGKKPAARINAPYVAAVVDRFGVGPVSRILQRLSDGGVKMHSTDEAMTLYRKPEALKRVLGAKHDGSAFGYRADEIREFEARISSKAKGLTVPTRGPGVRDLIFKKASIAACLRRACNATHTHPTPGQAAAGNYAKGDFTFQGIPIKIENPEGTTRRGYDKDGKETWSRTMTCSYGYFKGTKAIDGDAVDVFIGPDLDSDLVVAIDQYRGDKFDETKFCVGVKTQAQGEKLYLSNYPKGWKLGPVSTTTVPQLKEWLKTRGTMKKFEGQQMKAAAWWHRDTKVSNKLPDEADKAANLRTFPRNFVSIMRTTFGDTFHDPKPAAYRKDRVKKANEPSALGTGLGPFLADTIPFMPTGARRAGAASVMAQRIGQDPSVLLKYPMLSQLLAGMAGGALASTVDGAAPRAAVGLLPLVAVQALKRHRIQSVQQDYLTHKRKRLSEIGGLGELAGASMGSHKLGVVQAYEAMRQRKLKDIGVFSEAADTLPIVTSMLGLGPAASVPLTAPIDHWSAGRMMKAAAAPLLTRAVGRVVTNIIDPYGYKLGNTWQRLKSQGLVNNVKAVINDKPAYMFNDFMSDRNLPYRRMFGLPAHSVGARKVYTKNGPGSFRFNPSSRQAADSLEGVADTALAARRKVGPVTSERTFMGEDKVMGGYSGKLLPDGNVTYKDRWDFDLQKSESPLDGGSNMLRWLMSKITKPVVVEGKIDPRSPLVKRSDFSDQINAPAIPLFLAAAYAADRGHRWAGNNAVAQMSGGPRLDRGEWEGVASAASGKRPIIASRPGLGNAMWTRATNEPQAELLSRLAASDPHNLKRPELPRGRISRADILRYNDEVGTALGKLEDFKRRAASDGAILADPALSSGAIFAHEGGHGRIEHTPGFVKFLQDKVYPHADKIAPIAGAVSMGAGLASGGTLKGLLAGTGIGLVSGMGTLVPEATASMHGIRTLKDYQGGKFYGDDTKKQLLSALSSYAAGAALPSALAGAAGGWISGRRKAKRQAAAAGVEKEASSLKETGDVLLRASRLWKRRQFDLADSLVRGSRAVNAYGFKQGERFFRQHPEVAALGGHKRTPLEQLVAALANRSAPPV